MGDFFKFCCLLAISELTKLSSLLHVINWFFSQVWKYYFLLEVWFFNKIVGNNTTASRQKLGQIKEIQPSAQIDNQNSYHFVYYKYYHLVLLRYILWSFRYIYHFRIVSPVSGMFIVYQTFGIYLDCIKMTKTKVDVKSLTPIFVQMQWVEFLSEWTFLKIKPKILYELKAWYLFYHHMPWPLDLMFKRIIESERKKNRNWFSYSRLSNKRSLTNCHSIQKETDA